MQDLNKFKKYLIYILIATLAYFAGDQKLLNDIFSKLNINVENHGQSISQTNQGLGHESKGNKIYFIGKYKVTNVVDGDTVHVWGINENNINIKNDIVRIMAVNTLEMKETDPIKLCFAKKQTQFTKDHLLQKEVYLYGDKTQPKRDKYERLLAYVSTSSSADYFYNDYIVETGNADVYRATPPASLFERFESKKNVAAAGGLGMWSNDCK